MLRAAIICCKLVYLRSKANRLRRRGATLCRMSVRLLRQEPNQIGGAANRDQAYDCCGNRQGHIEAAYAWSRCHNRRGAWRGRCRPGCRRCRWSGRGAGARRSRCMSRRRSERRGWRGCGGWAAWRQSRQFDRRRSRRFRRQIDPDGLFFRLDLAGLFLGWNCAGGSIGNVLSHKF